MKLSLLLLAFTFLTTSAALAETYNCEAGSGLRIEKFAVSLEFDADDERKVYMTVKGGPRGLSQVHEGFANVRSANNLRLGIEKSYHLRFNAKDIQFTEPGRQNGSLMIGNTNALCDR